MNDSDQCKLVFVSRADALKAFYSNTFLVKVNTVEF